MTPSSAVPVQPASRVPMVMALFAWVAIPLNFGIWSAMFFKSGHPDDGGLLALFTLVAVIQFIFGVAALVSGIRDKRVLPAVFGVVAALGSVGGWVLGLATLALGSVGGSWGRPLRVRGRQLHPNLRDGADWTRGAQPSPAGLDMATRRALEALWLHDAQKEHASVPAFARVSWVLAAVGAPAELLEWSLKAGLEELEHTRLCFALAAGYGGRSHTVEAMPDLLVGGLTLEGDPLCALATESLTDGCQLEDFNADVAAECARACQEPVTRGVLERIAVEERSHAEFSWAVLAWVLKSNRARVEGAIEQALERLDRYPRPTAVGHDKRALVEAADATQLHAHGRLPDARWSALWVTRLGATRARTRALLTPASSARAA